MKNIEEQLKIITKGIENLVNLEELKKKLEKSIENNKPLTIKFGLDPSAPDIHLGHAVLLRKIKQLQDLDHKVVIVIGDFTGKIGDPTGKSKGRKALSDEVVKENAKTYVEQLYKILDKDKTEVMFNSTWLKKLNLEEVINLASTTTVARMLERDDFKKRYNNNIPISIHEFFYPLMQGYDSVMINSDIELGGTDQTFNILMGRTLQKSKNLEPQIAIFMPLLEGLDGVEKMSKSLGNYIGVFEEAEVMFKKVMEVPDKLIIKYFELCTDIHPDNIDVIKKKMKDGENPRDIKLLLAETITSLYHTKEEVEKAISFYNKAFTKKEMPDDIDLLKINKNSLLIDIIHLLVENDLVQSNNEFKRLVKQGGVKLNNEKINTIEVEINNNDVLKIGKKKFIKFQC